MSHPRLSLALEMPEALPPEGDIALFAPVGTLDLGGLPVDRLVAIQPEKPDHDVLAQRGVRVSPTAEGSYAAAIIFAPRAKAEARALIAEACQRVAPGGPIYVDGVKTEGIDSLLKELRGRVDLSAPIAKAHGKIAWFAAAPDLLSDWAAQDIHPVEGFVTRPGVFSADAVDEGSALLAECLPDSLPSKVADLGAGWGWLSAQILAKKGVERLDLVESDAVALDCAKRNISDPRAQFLWADATRHVPEERYTAVVMNPPFHGAARGADPALGLAFIQAARGMLSLSGTLWMVANRHLPYADALAAAFHEIEEVTPPSGPSTRFRIIRAAKPIPAGKTSGKSAGTRATAEPKRSLAPRKRR
ncbi:class I SAM-dependent methyltransferase [Thioclava sp. F36-6]|uniref:class I SAM-dependent methyltransferase n=1 Tax=Thioclava sp. F36-6 TaxID=1915316 RepID=UPI00099877D8|nr:class I SAM-dependent methyltransferase [Thioclava sp. F36-6]OOY31450.1 MFS transporter [Thioclava sp. F36-6]